ncbi:MAG: YraN family protein [Pyrinomonadaceae bacterium]|nr:YraN family protein [Pyrinomonadaceae bacterium]
MSKILSLGFQNKHLSANNSSFVGQLGEEMAARFLVNSGFRLVLSNFKVPIGRNSKDAPVTGEIDLIALESDILCFVEVKTRSSDEYSSPLSAVNLRKQRQITRTARVYRKIFNLRDAKFRYDVVSIVLNAGEPKIELFRNFWTESKFRKKNWNDVVF